MIGVIAAQIVEERIRSFPVSITTMPAIPRQLLVDPTEVGVSHCIHRCVRRAFLRGHDAVAGHSFEHRKGRNQNRLQSLTGQFGIDVPRSLVDVPVSSRSTDGLMMLSWRRPGLKRRRRGRV